MTPERSASAREEMNRVLSQVTTSGPAMIGTSSVPPLPSAGRCVEAFGGRHVQAGIEDELIEHDDGLFVSARDGIKAARIECDGGVIDLGHRHAGGEVVVHLLDGDAGLRREVLAMAIERPHAWQR